MTGLRSALVAASLLSPIAATSALAQEPAAFQAMFPNRDVLNNGALTPAGRQGLEQPFGAPGIEATNNANAGMDHAGPAPALRPRGHRKGRP